jgi:hypothetical protein
MAGNTYRVGAATMDEHPMPVLATVAADQVDERPTPTLVTPTKFFEILSSAVVSNVHLISPAGLYPHG